MENIRLKHFGPHAVPPSVPSPATSSTSSYLTPYRRLPQGHKLPQAPNNSSHSNNFYNRFASLGKKNSAYTQFTQPSSSYQTSKDAQCFPNFPGQSYQAQFSSYQKNNYNSNNNSNKPSYHFGTDSSPYFANTQASQYSNNQIYAPGGLGIGSQYSNGNVYGNNSANAPYDNSWGSGANSSYGPGKPTLTSKYSFSRPFLQPPISSGGNHHHLSSYAYDPMSTPPIHSQKTPPAPNYPQPTNSYPQLTSSYAPPPKQPPEATGYREPPMLNDKLFPRDNPWPDDMGVGGGMGFKGPHLQVRGLVYETRGQGGRTHLLDGISVEARGGEVLAIMATNENEGSCLLDVLADRHRKWGGRLRGDFILNGNNIKPSKVASRAAYVQQDVNFCQDMSVRQTLLLHSFFRSSGHVGRVREVKARINGLINDLGLEQVRHTRVKDLTLSERRRLNVACGLLLETDLVLLDQPTRGMDIFDTFFLVEYLRQWAGRGRIVILTIQPPTYEIFTMISRVALISTGRLMYFGKRREMLPYFAFIEYPCPAYKNPSDYYLDLVTLDDLSAEAMLESSQRVEMLAETFRRRQEALSDPGSPGPLPEEVRKENLCMQLLGLWIRAMIFQFPYNMVHWLLMALVAGATSLAIGCVFWDVRAMASSGGVASSGSASTGSIPQQQEGVNNRAGFHYAMAGLGPWPVLLMAISEVWRDRPAVARDVEDGLYSRGVYIVTKTCYSFLAAGGAFLAYVLPAYTMAGLPAAPTDAEASYAPVGLTLLYLYAVRAVAVATACLFEARHTAAMATGLVLTVATVGAGFTVHPLDMSLWTWPTLWWSPTRWLFHEANRYEFNTTTSEFLCDRNPVLQDTFSVIQRKAPCGIVTGSQALRYLGLPEGSLSQPHHPALIILGAYLLGQAVTILAFVLCRKSNRTKKYRTE